MYRFDLDEDYDTNGELIEEFDELMVMCYMMMLVMMSSYNLFNANELEEICNPSINMLGNMQSLPSVFQAKL